MGLVTQMPETMGAVVPSKTYGIMAAGRPVLFIGPQGATPARVVARHGCGWRVEPGDVAGLVRLLERLEQDRSLVREAGSHARCAFEKYYDKPIGVARILSILGVSEIPANPAFADITPSAAEPRSVPFGALVGSSQNQVPLFASNPQGELGHYLKLALPAIH